MLPPDIQDEVDRLAEEGNAWMDTGEYVQALAAFRRGIEVLPPPRDRWDAAMWFLAGIGDALWFLGRHVNARPIWDDAIVFVGGFGNAFVHLRRGQTMYELGDYGEAANELLRALLLGGAELFADDSRKYWDFITSRARPPEGMASWEGWAGAEPGSPLHDWLMNPGVYEFRHVPPD
ncbi:MAG TPA: tetratricopeptide repeat protein [Longimicrobium sp.]|nr:tetratricopeptide repeat protein [Longimicrobium sp.]